MDSNFRRIVSDDLTAYKSIRKQDTKNDYYDRTKTLNIYIYILTYAHIYIYIYIYIVLY